MKTVFFTLLLVLIASLMGLEIMSSRAPAQSLIPTQLRDSAPQARPVFGG